MPVFFFSMDVVYLNIWFLSYKISLGLNQKVRNLRKV